MRQRLTRRETASPPPNNEAADAAATTSQDIGDVADTDDAPREFRFSIEDDDNLRALVSHSASPMDTESVTAVSMAVGSAPSVEVSSEYILSKLFNFMKISEMNKYGIRVFQVTFTSFLPYLTEGDLFRLATSYWCNGEHFRVMTAHRGDRIKDAVLSLSVTEDLLDAAMQSGASVDKIEAMLLQKREDEAVTVPSRWRRNGKVAFFQTKGERSFYRRNLKHRFWSHEVLVRVFVRNGWLTPDLADFAMKTFVATIYHRVLQSTAPRPNNNGGIKLTETFLTAFFADHFCRDDIPKMYREEIRRRERIFQRNKKSSGTIAHHLSEETLRRWCELIELLASRGATVPDNQFAAMIPLQYALEIGSCTFKLLSASHKQKNKMLIPEHFHHQNIAVPDDIWDVLVSYL